MSTSNNGSKEQNKLNKIKKCAGKDCFQRMNYLYQVSNALPGKNLNNNQLSVLCSNLLISISRKSVQRLDVDVKRTICKGCRAVIIPGVNCKVKVEKKHLKWICMVCNTRKVFKVSGNSKYCVPWVMREDAVAEILDYGANHSSTSHLQ